MEIYTGTLVEGQGTSTMLGNILSNVCHIISNLKKPKKMDREDVVPEEIFNQRKKIHTLEQLQRASQNEINWENLSYPVTVQVFSYLCDKDRVSVSQVCRKWNKCFKSPTLWRKRKFLIGNLKGYIGSNLPYAYKLGFYNSVKYYISFTSIFGSCLREVDIECLNISEHQLLTIIPLLENIKNARLQSFNLKELMLEQNSWIWPELKLPIIKSIKNMFQTQTELKKVYLKMCGLDLVTGTEVLELLAASTGRELQYLDLKDYFDCFIHAHDFQPFQQTIKAFTNLSHISIDYSYMSEELLLHWCVSLRHKLQTMDVVTSYRDMTNVISNETWTKLSDSCPKLRVFISVIGVSDATDYIRLLKPTIPLHAFKMFGYFRSAQEKQLSVLLKYLVDCFQHRLEKVTFDFERMQDSVDSELIYLLERCRLLESFCVNAKVGDRVIHTICDLLRDSQSVLRTVKISSCGGNNIPEIQDTLRLIQDIMPED